MIINYLAQLDNANTDFHHLLRKLDELGTLLATPLGTRDALAFTTLYKEHVYLALSCVMSYQKRDLTDILSNQRIFLEHATVMGTFLSSLGLSPKEDLIELCLNQNQYILHMIEAQCVKHYNIVVKYFDAYYVHLFHLAGLLFFSNQK